MSKADCSTEVSVFRGHRLRRADIRDAAALETLEASCFTTDRITPRQWRYQLRRPSIEVWLAPTGEDSTLPRGALVLFFRRGSRLARIYSLAVLPADRGLGLGGALLELATERARDRGCTRLALEVREDNGPALRLYERAGFEVKRTLTGYYDDGATGLRLEKAVRGPGATTAQGRVAGRRRRH
jgi:ribosomal protein S18 acetylase RimI-like enzyme